MNTEMQHDYADRIRLERMKRSWTQEHLAETAGLSTRTIQRLEKGADASPETVRLLATAFGLTMEAFNAPRLRRQFTAPWDQKLKVITLVVSVALILFAVFLKQPWSPLIMVLILVMMFFSVRGYSLKGGKLFIHRLGWSNSLELAGLTGISVNPQAMMGSLRVFGMGGMFAYVGYFRNSHLGTYRAFATHTGNCLVLQFADKNVVVTPDSPEAMKLAVEEELKALSC